MLLLNDKKVDYFIFPGGELQVKLPEKIEAERVILTWKPTDAKDIMLLLLTINALKYMVATDIYLDILYLPYARQDRVCSPGEAFSLEVICQLIGNIENFIEKIRIFDPHNPKEVSFWLDNFAYFVRTEEIFSRYDILAKFNLKNLTLCCPDEGAKDRVFPIVYHFGLPPSVNFEKKRNLHTGEIQELKYCEDNQDIKGRDILIVDDICDGGSTFLQVAEILRGRAAANLYLYVTHGIFSKGLDELSQVFEHIYCHHVLHDDKFKSNDKLTILREFNEKS